MKASTKNDLYRKLPSVDELLHRADVAPLVSAEGLAAVTDAARIVLERMRAEIAAGHLESSGVELAISGIVGVIERQLRTALQFSMRAVINATGVILHTNLGRAPLGAAALQHVEEIAGSYSNLEFSLSAGERGKRDAHLDRWFAMLLTSAVASEPAASARQAATSQISTLVVNNNAAAVLLALNTLAEGGEAVVSRGELVEIGGSFRIPEVMTKSNVVLREVGTTNRTRISDYEKAINEKTRLLLRVHRSNFEITGFTEQPRVEELVALARQRNVPLLEDLGSGSFLDLSLFGIKDEPGVLDSLRAGVDVVTYSGDKLLGGPQAGMLSGRTDLIARMRANSLFRALRVDKLTYAALEATLLAYVKRDYDSIPALRMMHWSQADIGVRADAVVSQMRSEKMMVEVMDGESVIGGGAAPTAVLPTRLLAVAVDGLSADELAVRLRALDPPLLARVQEGRVLLDLRTVFPEQDKAVVSGLKAITTDTRRHREIS